MSNARDKAQGFAKQIIGEMIGDTQLVEEGKAQRHYGDGKDGTRTAANAAGPSLSDEGKP